MTVTTINGRKLNRPATLAEAAQAAKQKMEQSGRYRPISDEEYQRLKLQQSEKLREQEAEQAQARRLEALPQIGLHSSELELNWKAVKPGISDGPEALKAVKPKYKQGHGMVFLWGTYGQAKTLIGKILTATAFRDGKTCAYANIASVLDDIRLAFDERENKTTELIRRMNWWISRDVLFIDELDKCNDTPWAQERMFQLLDQRYMRAIREEALTVIASNKASDQLDGYLKSRLNDKRLGPVVYLNGNDGREVMPEGWKF
jgi:DNA replication protein DnaC